MPPALPRVAALTMVRDEAALLPIWCGHYLRQVGAGNLYVLDHASRDGGTRGIPAQVTSLPDGPLDEALRVARVTEAVRDLLRTYDWVVHSDVDELVLADPRHSPTLADYAVAEPSPVARAVGIDLHHIPDEEPPLDPALPLGAQRRWVRFAASMCKPALVREAVRWTPGFHTSEPTGRFGALYCVHLRYVDLGMGLARLGRTRARAALPGTNPHQRVPDAEFDSMMRMIASLPKQADVPFDPALPPLRPWVERVREGTELGLAGDALWELPGRLRAGLGGE
jgi:hypothetical protein